MAVYKQKTFVGQRILLDGHTYNENKFQNCVLVYGGGPLSFSNNSLSGVRWKFVDNAARTLALLSSFYQSGGSSKEYVEFLLSTFNKQIENPKPTTSEGGSR